MFKKRKEYIPTTTPLKVAKLYLGVFRWTFKGCLCFCLVKNYIRIWCSTSQALGRFHWFFIATNFHHNESYKTTKDCFTRYRKHDLTWFTTNKFGTIWGRLKLHTSSPLSLPHTKVSGVDRRVSMGPATSRFQRGFFFQNFPRQVFKRSFCFWGKW